MLWCGIMLCVVSFELSCGDFVGDCYLLWMLGTWDAGMWVLWAGARKLRVKRVPGSKRGRNQWEGKGGDHGIVGVWEYGY